MNKEEKEAIEQLRSWRDYIIKNKDKVNKANDIEFYLRTVLNLIQKQEEEIKKLKENISNMYDEKVVRNILEDECGLSKYEIDEILN